MTIGSTSGPRLPVASRRGSPLVEGAYNQIRDAIGSLVLQPGQPLTEASLSEWLGVGRTPVREALLRLRDEGLVESIPRKGYYVSRISPDEAQEIYEVLEGLEGVAAKLAAERATPEDLDRLEGAVGRMERALAKDDPDEWAAADEEAHDVILEMARNRQIQRAVQPLKVRIRRMQLFTLRRRSNTQHSTRVHRAQLEAIRAGDGRLARELRQDLWVRAAAELVEIARRYAGPAGVL